jgi:hypothetical protein
MAEVSQQIFLGTNQVFAFYDDKWSGINSYEQGPPSVIQVRNDPYSASLVLAMPYSNFSELGMTAYTQSLDGLIRTGNQANSYQIRATGSAAFLYPSASVTTFSASLWSDEAYTSSMAIQNAQNAGTYISELGANSFVIEFFINVQAASFTNPPFHRHIFGQTAGDNLTIQYSSTPQFRFYVNQVNTWSTTPNFNLGFSNQNWKHVAIVKSGTNVYVYVNGTRIGVGTRAATINSGQPNQFILGHNNNNDGLFSLIQDYRVYVGTDKGYTGATITVPSSIVDQT